MDDFEVAPIGTMNILNMLRDYYNWCYNPPTKTSNPSIEELTTFLDKIIIEHEL